MEKTIQDKQEMLQRVIVFLNREQVDFLDKLGKDTLFSGKKKLTRTKIMSRFVDLLQSLDINGNDLLSEESLKEGLKKKIGMVSSKEIFNFKD